MDIRNALLQKLQGSSSSDLKQIIADGIASREETILPGLGVLFEEYYSSLDSSKQESFVSEISSLLK